jgi:hypothetical protein
MLKSGTVVDATLIATPSLTKNKDGERDPEMHQTKKGNQWHFGMKCHIGVDADSGLAHTVVGTAANVNDVPQTHALVHGEEANVFADAGYQGVAKRDEVQGIKANWHVAMRPGKRKALDRLEHLKASIRAKVEHPFRVIKRQFWHLKVRYRGLAKKHGTVAHAVCPEQPLNGASPAFAGVAGMSASAIGQRAAHQCETTPLEPQNPTALPSSEIFHVKARHCGGFEHPPSVCGGVPNPDIVTKLTIQAAPGRYLF